MFITLLESSNSNNLQTIPFSKRQTWELVKPHGTWVQSSCLVHRDWPNQAQDHGNHKILMFTQNNNLICLFCSEKLILQFVSFQLN